VDKKFPVAEKNNAGSNKQTNNNRTIWPKGKKYSAITTMS